MIAAITWYADRPAFEPGGAIMSLSSHSPDEAKRNPGLLYYVREARIALRSIRAKLAGSMGSIAMKTGPAAVLIALLGLWPGSASSQTSNSSMTAFIGGNELFRRCGSKGADLLFCQGYIAGITDALSLTEEICLPQNSDLRQSFDVVTNYLRGHPETRHRAAASEAADALKQAFPCK